MSIAITVTGGLLTAILCSQIGYLWTFEELTSKADLVVIAEPVRTDDTGRRPDHPNLTSALPVTEFVTTFKVMAVLKPDSTRMSRPVEIRLKHYQLDENEWRRRNRVQTGNAPAGLVNAGTYLDFSGHAGAYLLFLARGGADAYEPLSGHTFPTNSVYKLRE